MLRRLILALLTFGCGAAHAAETNCDVLLAAHLLDPVRTYQTGEVDGRYAAMNRFRYVETILDHRSVVTEYRSRATPGSEEFILHLDRRVVGRDGFAIKTYLVVDVVEEDVRYDYRSGTVGTGNMGGEALRPSNARFRFELERHPSVTRYELHRLHDELIPLVQARLHELNDAAESKFGRPLMFLIFPRYPGEYESELTPNITAEELGFLVAALGSSTATAREPAGDL